MTPHKIDESMNNDISLRDYFAAAALQGLLVNIEPGETIDDTSEMAYKCADSMLDVRREHEKKQKNLDE